jgi:hypothetical protein
LIQLKGEVLLRDPLYDQVFASYGSLPSALRVNTPANGWKGGYPAQPHGC